MECGLLKVLTNKSGHYKPGELPSLKILELLLDKGFKLENIKFVFVAKDNQKTEVWHPAVFYDCTYAAICLLFVLQHTCAFVRTKCVSPWRRVFACVTNWCMAYAFMPVTSVLELDGVSTPSSRQTTETAETGMAEATPQRRPRTTVLFGTEDSATDCCVSIKSDRERRFGEVDGRGGDVCIKKYYSLYSPPSFKSETDLSFCTCNVSVRD